MVLLEFYHDSSHFTSPVTSIHAGAHDDRHCVCERERERKKERVHMAGVHERIGALLTLVVSGSEPWPPVWRASALSIA